MPHCPVCHSLATRPFIQLDGRDYLRCGACQATFVHPEQLPDVEPEQAYYALHDNRVDDPGYRQFLSRLSIPLLAKLPAAQHGLDYGCGPGPALAAMLEEAGQRMHLYDPLFHADDTALQGQYDFITCTEVVEHFHHPAKEFSRFDRLLKPGGWLGIMTCFQSDDARFANWHYRRDPTHVVFYREATFHWLAGHHGWRCESPCKDVALIYKPIPPVLKRHTEDVTIKVCTP